MEKNEINTTETQQKMTEKEIELANIAFEVSVMLVKARAALRTTISNYNLDSTNLTHVEEMYLVIDAGTIHQMLEIVDDYLFMANNMLEDI